MTQIYVNEECVNTPAADGNLTVNELYKEIIDSYADKNDVVTELLIDNKSYFDNNTLGKTNINQTSSIQFYIQNKYSLANQALDSCCIQIDKVVEHVNYIVSSYRENKAADADIGFVQLVEALDIYVQLITNIHQTLKGKFKNESQVQNLEHHLFSILKSLVPAKEKSDVIMLCDLLEYELIDNLEQWKTVAIPTMKQASSC